MIEITRVFLFFSFIVITSYFAWAGTGRNLEEFEYNQLTFPVFTEKVSQSYDKKSGNILAIETKLTQADYSRVDRFYKKLEAYLLDAQKNGLLNEKTLVVFPEHIGSPFVLLGEKREVFHSKELSSAVRYMIYSNFVSYVISSFSRFSLETSYEKFFHLKKELIAKAYISSFTKLSVVFGVTIVAGSVVLPELEIKENQFEFKSNTLMNQSFVFLPDGKIFPQIFFEKNNSSFEKFFKNNEVIETKLKLPNISDSINLLSSSDSHYSSSYSKILSSNDIIVSYGFLPKDEKTDWSQDKISSEPIGGKSIFQDSDKSLSEEALMQKFSFVGKFSYLQSKAGIQVFMKGQFFEYDLVGQSSLLFRYVRNDILPIKKDSTYMLNFWL
ncbi:MAG: hypothetical protein SFU98_07510 [Leptospiraceae bacterium]|nr:hypothetical protein [Leptospiraceae bacterium]